MAKKKAENKDIEEIKDLLGSEKLIIGADRTIKNIKLGNIAKIFLAKNAPGKLVEDVEYYSKLADYDIVKLDIDNEELGIVCRKPFLISVVSLVK